MKGEKKEIQERIRKLLEERKAILLAHNYQRDEIQEIADFQGDSLQLSIEASKTGAEVIVFCGVHFMAESAKILSPEKIVLLPNIMAGCPMADMITKEGLRQKKKELPGHLVVTYVNSSAEVKAESDICCTSANATAVLKSLDGRPVLFTPDRNLGQYLRKETGQEISLWDGYCYTHDRVRAKEVAEKKSLYPDALVVVHPECRPEVIDLADAVLSTSGMYRFCKGSDKKRFIIVTESGILYRLRKENPEKEFIIASKKLICATQKITSLRDVEEALLEMKHEIQVPEEIRVRARAALDRMLSIPRDR